MHFYAHVNCDVKSKISGRRWTASYRGGRGFRDLKWTMTRWGEPVLSLFNFSLFSHIRSRSGCRRNRFPEKILKTECSVEGQRLGRDCKIINQFWVKLTFGHSVLMILILHCYSYTYSHWYWSVLTIFLYNWSKQQKPKTHRYKHTLACTHRKWYDQLIIISKVLNKMSD